MLISEIPFKKVRELAEHYARTIPYLESSRLKNAFIWAETYEGEEFWRHIYHENLEFAKTLRPDLFDDEETQPAKTANKIVPMHMPQLPKGWIYTGEYRRPHKGEYILINGKVRVSRGQEMAYPIAVREPETD